MSKPKKQQPEIEPTKKSDTAAKTVSAGSKAKGAKSAKPAPAKDKRTAKKDDAPSSKTPQVLKLVEPHGDYVNPVLVAGKSSIPKQLRGVEPLSRIMRREAREILGEDITGLPEEHEEEVTINLTAVAIAENAAPILRRFNACDCEKCVHELTRMVSEKVPARFVKINKRDAERNSDELTELKEPLKKAVVSQMIRVMLVNKKRSFHE